MLATTYVFPLSLLVCFIGFAIAKSSKYSSPYLDPFYDTPSNISLYAPGSIIRNRTVTSQMSNVTAQQIFYRTTDSNNVAIATAATILRGPAHNRHQLVAYQDAEDSVNRTCAPSWLFASGQQGQGDIAGPGSYKGALSYGWTLVVPDFEGPNSALMAGHLAGKAVLDSMRAAIRFPGSDLIQNTSIGAFGYSGGAFATAWASALHRSYAPELNIVGFVMGGTPTNATAALLSVDATAVSAFGFAAIAGLMQEFPSLKTHMNKILTKKGATSLQMMREVCNAANTTNGYKNGQTQLQLMQYQALLSSTMQSDGPNLFVDPTVSSIFNTLNLGVNTTETPKAPIYMYHGVEDQVVPYYDAVNTAKAWCKQGATINFASESGLGVGHYLTMIELAQPGLRWLSLRMQGIRPPAGCQWDTDFFGMYVNNTGVPTPPVNAMLKGF